MSVPSAFPRPVLLCVFVGSGISALIYQLVWQRMLLMLYGSNVESVAMVVAAFLMGLGLGSLAGGEISRLEKMPLVLCFSAAELGVGIYGLLSVDLFEWVGRVTGGASGLLMGTLAFALVLIPTLLMGATLPLLVTHQVLATGHVGKSVSWLYFVNTLGASLGAFLAAFWVLRVFGLSGSVRLAATLNGCISFAVFLTWVALRKKA